MKKSRRDTEGYRVICIILVIVIIVMGWFWYQSEKNRIKVINELRSSQDEVEELEKKVEQLNHTLGVYENEEI